MMTNPLKSARSLIGAAALATLLGLGAAPAGAAGVPMVIQADTVLSGQCVLSNQFKHGDAIVFRIRVIDTATGEPLAAEGLKSLVVELADGTKLDAHFGQHPPQEPVDSYWTVAFPIPDDYPTGTFTYKVVATNGAGETATFVPFAVPPSQLTVVASQ